MYPADEGVYLADEGVYLADEGVYLACISGRMGPGYGYQAWVADLGSGHGDRGMGT